MEEITIYKYQLEAIKEALRMAANYGECRKLASCYDRDVMHAVAIVDKVLEGGYKERIKRPM